MAEVIDLTDERRPRRFILLFLLVWTALFLLKAVLMKVQLPRVPLTYALANNFVETYTLAALSIAVWWMTRWLHERKLSRPALIVAHVAFGLAVMVVWKGVKMLYLYLTMGPQFWARIYADSWAFQLVTVLMTYGALIGATLALQSAGRERQRERQQARLELATREAELAALKAQLQPHFLFNSLNSIVALMDTDPLRAREMVVRLAALLQAALRRVDLEQVSLDGELEIVRAYLDIEKIRFASRLDVAIEVDDAALAASIPPLLLQPLVENAVKHGIALSPGGGRVRVAGRVDGGRLSIEVSDSARATAEDRSGSGLGLELTRRRLEAAYGADFGLRFHRHPDRFEVRLDLPFAHV